MKSPQQPKPEGSASANEAQTSSDKFFRTDHLMDTIGGRTARGGVVTMASHGLKFAVSIVATAILARLLSPHDYGLIGMVAVATNFVVMFKDLGLSLATVQKAEISSRQISTLFWVNLTLSGITMLVMFLLAPAISWFYGDSRLTMIAVVSATGFLIGGLTVQHEALLKRQMRFMALSAVALVAMIVGYIVGIAFAWYGFGYWSLVFSQLALLATDAILVWMICGWRPGLPRRGTGVRSMLSFGGNITAYGTVNYFSKNADNLLIGKFFGPQQLGLYNKAAQLVGLPTDQVHEPVMAVTVPALSRLADSPERYRKAYLRIMEKVLMLVMPAVALLIVSSDWLVSIVLGSQWKDAGPNPRFHEHRRTFPAGNKHGRFGVGDPGSRPRPVLLVADQLAAFNTLDFRGATLGCNGRGGILFANASFHHKSPDVLVRWPQRPGQDNGFLPAVGSFYSGFCGRNSRLHGLSAFL